MRPSTVSVTPSPSSRIAPVDVSRTRSAYVRPSSAVARAAFFWALTAASVWFAARVRLRLAVVALACCLRAGVVRVEVERAVPVERVVDVEREAPLARLGAAVERVPVVEVVVVLFVVSAIVGDQPLSGGLRILELSPLQGKIPGEHLFVNP